MRSQGWVFRRQNGVWDGVRFWRSIFAPLAVSFCFPQPLLSLFGYLNALCSGSAERLRAWLVRCLGAMAISVCFPYDDPSLAHLLCQATVHLFLLLHFWEISRPSTWYLLFSSTVDCSLRLRLPVLCWFCILKSLPIFA